MNVLNIHCAVRNQNLLLLKHFNEQSFFNDLISSDLNTIFYIHDINDKVDKPNSILLSLSDKMIRWYEYITFKLWYPYIIPVLVNFIIPTFTGEFPKPWKKAKSQFSGLGSISILSGLSKVLKKIMTDQLNTFLMKNNILSST